MNVTAQVVRNGDVELHVEVMGPDDGPTLLLVNGLTSQLTSWTDPFCEAFVDRGFLVVRYDNRDCGLSTILDADDSYSLSDMAMDARLVGEAVGGVPMHVFGISMGGMIVQTLAAEHPAVVASMTSFASSTGNPDVGQPSEEAWDAILAPEATSRKEFVDGWLAGKRIWGTDETWTEEDVRAVAAAAWDRSPPAGGGLRQLQAIRNAGNRDEQVKTIQCPSLVMHGDADSLIDVSGGRHTAALIEGSTYVEVEAMGHDIPIPEWPMIVEQVTRLAASAGLS